MRIETQPAHYQGRPCWQISIDGNPIADLHFYSDHTAQAFCGILTQAVALARAMEEDMRMELESQGVLEHLDPKGSNLY